jgi:hypothetical protein
VLSACGDVARHQPDSFASRLPVRCLISGRLLHGELGRLLHGELGRLLHGELGRLLHGELGRLLHGELGRRVCLQAFVRVGAPLRIERS